MKTDKLLFFSLLTIILNSCLNQKTGEINEIYQVYNTKGNSISRKLISNDNMSFVMGINGIPITDEPFDLNNNYSWVNGKGFISQIDDQGLFKNEYFDDSNVLYSDVIIKDDIFYIVGSHNDQFLFKTFSFDGNKWESITQKQWKIIDSPKNIIDYIYFYNDAFFLVGRCLLNGIERLYVAKVDHSGVVDWEKTYIRGDIQQHPKSVRVKDNLLTILLEERDVIQATDEFVEYHIDLDLGVSKKTKYFSGETSNVLAISYLNQLYVLVRQNEKGDNTLFFLNNDKEYKINVPDEISNDVDIITSSESKQFVLSISTEEGRINYLFELINNQVRIIESYNSLHSNHLIDFKWDEKKRNRLFLLNTLLKFKYIIEVRNR